jgi:hypothetical protein
VHEPPPESPRFAEIYGKMKEFERQLNDKDETIGAMVDHQKSLQESLDSVYDKVSVSERPDAITDPEGHDQWLSDKIKRDIKREVPAPEVQPVVKEQDTDIKQQAQIMKDVYPDFDSVVSLANEFVKDDPIKKNDILFSGNAPRALYEYGLEKKAAIAKTRSNNIAQAGVEGGGTPPPTEQTSILTPMEEKVRKGLNITKEQYIQQKEFQSKRGF